MTTISLVRHGETDWNAAGRLQGHEDIELNERGRVQARSAGLCLLKRDWDIIVTSPLKRSQETANIIASILDIQNVQELEQFMERDYGASSGLTSDEVIERFPDGTIPGLEERQDLSRRVGQGLDIVVQRYIGKRIILVAHGGVINTILAMISNGKIGSGKTVLGNACISIIHHTENTWKIEFYNSTSHLDGMLANLE